MRGNLTTIKYRWNVKVNVLRLLPKPTGHYISSNKFSANSSAPEWSIALYPNGDSEDSKAFISLYLRLESFIAKEITACCRFSMLNDRNICFGRSQFIHQFDGSTTERGFSKFYVLNNVHGKRLHIICELCYDNDPKQGAIIDGTSANDRAIDISGAHDMKALSDVVIRIGDTDLPAHKVLLALRSPVFRAMFEHDTSEGNENIVNIVDFDLETIQEMLTYVYTGTVPNIGKVAASLLAVADKYDMPGLKKICEYELSKNICVDNFCNTLVLTDLHHAASLRNVCDAFFRKNAGEVIRSACWNVFRVEHADIAIILMTSVIGDDK
jgi:speckle-type POZ protein